MRKSVAILILLVSLVTSSCSWDVWKAIHIQTKALTNDVRAEMEKSPVWTPGRAAYSDTALTVWFDEDCSVDNICMQNMGDWDFWHNHEYGHIVDRYLGFPYGDNFIGYELGAQCAAAVLTDRNAHFWPGEFPYWNCPPEEVILTRRRMYDAGMLDEAKFQVEKEMVNA